MQERKAVGGHSIYDVSVNWNKILINSAYDFSNSSVFYISVAVMFGTGIRSTEFL